MTMLRTSFRHLLDTTMPPAEQSAHDLARLLEAASQPARARGALRFVTAAAAVALIATAAALAPAPSSQTEMAIFIRALDEPGAQTLDLHIRSKE